ncbi:hypothetical protein D3C72_1580840 [compost metagenome]
MDQRRPRRGELHLPIDLALRIHAQVFQRARDQVIVHRQHLAAGRVDLGMRGKRAGKPALECFRPHGGQRAIHDIGTAAFIQRVEPARMAQDIGIGQVGLWRRAEGGVVDPAAGEALFLQFAGQHPAVAVARATGLQMQGMDHAGAVVRVGVARARFELRIWAVAHEHPVQAGGQHAVHLQVRVVAFVEDGGEGFRQGGVVAVPGLHGRLRRTFVHANRTSPVSACAAVP